RDEYRFAFTGRPWPMDEDAIHWQLFAVLTLIFLCLSLGFFLSRRLLFPLRKMRRSTEAFGEGKWDTRLPAFGTTEFDELRISLNGMAERIARQFRAMEELLLAVSHEIRSPLTRM